MKKIPYWSRIYIANESGIKTPLKYAIVCEDHGTYTATNNFDKAIELTEKTHLWCAMCQAQKARMRKRIA